MQALKNTWNGFFAQRRLDQLWLETISKRQKHQQHYRESQQFINEFLSVVSKADGQISDHFAYRDQFLELLCNLLLESYNQNAGFQMDDEDFVQQAQAILTVCKDMIKQGAAVDEFVSVSSNLVKAIGQEQVPIRVKRMLMLIQVLFRSVEDLKLKLTVEHDIFTQLLVTFSMKSNQEGQAFIIDFFKSELFSISSSALDDRWSEPQKLSSQRYQTFFQKMTDKLISIPNEYAQQLMDRKSDLQRTLSKDSVDKNPFGAQTQASSGPSIPNTPERENPFEQANEEVEPLTSQQIDEFLKRRNSINNQALSDENDQIQQHLRKSAFMEKLKKNLKEADSKQYVDYLVIANIVGCFNEENWQEATKTVLPDFKKRLSNNKDDDRFKIFEVLLNQIVTNGIEDSKIRNNEALKFVLEVIESTKTDKYIDLLLSSLMRFKANPALFYRDFGFDWLLKLNLTNSAQNLIKFLLYTLRDLSTKCLEFLIKLIENKQQGAQLYQITQAYLSDLVYQNIVNEIQIVKDQNLCNLLTKSVELFLQSPDQAQLLLAACFEVQLHCKEELMTVELLKKVDNMIDSKNCDQIYLAAQLIKCKLHTKAEKLDIQALLNRVSEENQQSFLKMLFVPSNNKYAAQLKQGFGKPMLDTQYTHFLKAIKDRDTEKATYHFVNISVIMSSCAKTKEILDMKLNGLSLAQDFNLQDFNNMQQASVATCLVEFICDKTMQPALLCDFMNEPHQKPYRDFLNQSLSFSPLYSVKTVVAQDPTTKEHVNFRRIDYNFLILVLVQLQPSNLIGVLDLMREHLVRAQNKRILIEAGFQQFLAQLLELSQTLPKKEAESLKLVCLAMLDDLLELAVMTENLQIVPTQGSYQTALLSPSFLPMLKRLLASNSAPIFYTSVANLSQKRDWTSSRWLQIDSQMIDNQILLFTTSSGQNLYLIRSCKDQLNISADSLISEEPVWEYSLKSDNDEFQIDLWLVNNIININGWNHFAIRDDTLVLNSIQINQIKLTGSIIPSGNVLFDITESEAQIQFSKVEKNQLKFKRGQVDYQNSKIIEVLGQQCEYILEPVTIEISQSPHFSATQSVMPLKQYLSSQQTIQALFGLLDKANTDDKILESIQLVVALVTKNPIELNVDLAGLIERKMMEMHPDGIFRTLSYLLDLSLDQVQAHLRVNPTDDQLRTQQLIPALVKPQYLEVVMQLLAKQKVPAEQGAKFLEMLKYLLQNQQNLLAFYEQFGIEPILNVFELVKKNERKLALYEQNVGVFELFIDACRTNVLETKALQLTFDFILSLSLQNTAPAITQRICIDLLAVVMIHLVVDDSNNFLPQLLKLNIVPWFYKILQSPLVEVREYAIKVVCLFLHLSPEVRRDFNYSIAEGILSLQEQSMTLCTTILDASINKFINVNDLTPPEDALVIQMMNGSRTASKIVTKIKEGFEQKKQTKFQYFSLIDCFFSALAQVQNDVQKHMCLKQLSTMLLENNNIEQIFCEQGLLQTFLFNMFQFQIKTTSREDLTQSTRQFYDNYLFQKHITLESDGQEYKPRGYSSTEDDHQLTPASLSTSQLSSGEQATPPTRTLDALQELLTQIVMRDISKPQFQSQIFNIMQTNPMSDDRMQVQILARILRFFNKQPRINDLNQVLNLYRIFANLDKLMVESEILSLKVINLINLIAFKSTTEVRKIMKEQRLLELRDNLMVQQIRKTYKIGSKYFIESLAQFSFEALASKPIFSQNCGAEYLTLILDKSFKMQIGASDEIQERLVSEVFQFPNNITVPNLVEAVQKGKPLPQSVIKACEGKIKEHLAEQLEQREQFKRERIGRRQILVEEHKKLQDNKHTNLMQVLI